MTAAPLVVVEVDLHALAGVLMRRECQFCPRHVVNGRAITTIGGATICDWYTAVGWSSVGAGVFVIDAGFARVDDSTHEVVGEAVAPTTFRSRAIGSIFSG